MMKIKTIFFIGITIAFLACKSTSELDINGFNLTVKADEVLFNGVESTFSATITGKAKSVTFYFDGKSIGSMISEPFEVKFTPKDYEPIEHEIKCIAENDQREELTISKKVTIKLRVGDEYKGGKIYVLDSNGKNGLIAATQDFITNSKSGFVWGSYTLLGTSKNNGFENTKKMAASGVGLGYYFKNGLLLNGFNDWFIPSSDELKVLKEMKGLIGGFSTKTNYEGLYWSSSEIDTNKAEAINFNSLMGNSYDKQSFEAKVRVIRKF